MYSIAVRRGLDLLDIAWQGAFAEADVRRYAHAVAREFGQSGLRPGYLLRMDMTESAVQPQAALPWFRTMFSGFPVARKIAIVTPSALARMQVRREMPQPHLRMFDTPDAALAWLLEPRTAQA